MTATRMMMEQPCQILTPSEEVVSLLGHYVRYLADQMRLRDWKFEIGFDPDQKSPGKIVIAQCRREAAIVFGHKLFTMDAAERRYIAVHELMHCHLQPLRDSVGTAEILLSQTWPVIRKGHDNAIENAVHDLAAMHSAYLMTFEQWCEASIGSPASQEPSRLPKHGRVHEPQRAGRRRVHSQKRRG